MSRDERQAISAEVEKAWAGIVAAQESLRDPSGKYQQVMKSSRPADKPGHKPNALTWNDLDVAGIWGYGKDKMKGEWAFDEYESPRGKGFVFHGRFSDEQGEWCCAWQHGPEDSFAFDWVKQRV